MIQQRTAIMLAAITLLSGHLMAAELPRLPEGTDSTLFNAGEQKKLPDIAEAYVSTSPEDLGDGLQVGTLDVPGAEEAVKALLADDQAGKYKDLDSILVWKDGKLIFEYYNRRGRVDAPHYTMSATKTATSILLARAIQVGLLSMEDLDKPMVSFMPEIDQSKIQSGAETITIRDALYMKSGLKCSKELKTLGKGKTKQEYFQQVFATTAPITPESKVFKYSGMNPTMTLMVLDIKAPGSVIEFFEKELMAKIGGIYSWTDSSIGIPQGGAGLSLSSRTMVKLAVTVLQEGKFNGEQLLSPEYTKLIMDTREGEGYYYHFHNRHKYSSEAGKVDFISGIGAGGQYMSIYPDLNMVVAATAHNKKGGIGTPLNAVLEHLIPLFTQKSKNAE